MTFWYFSWFFYILKLNHALRGISFPYFTFNIEKNLFLNSDIRYRQMVKDTAYTLFQLSSVDNWQVIGELTVVTYC